MIHLIQPRSLFGPSERQAELLTCWRKTDEQDLFTAKTHPEGRPTFTELFSMCLPGMVNVIANSDIYFDGTIHFAKPTAGHCYALSRWDVNADGSIALWDHADSADVWVFFGQPPKVEIPWTMGIPGIDNRLAWELQNAGMVVTNPSRTIKTYHIHNIAYRSYLVDENGQGRGGDKIIRVPPPYAHVKPVHLP